MTAKLRKLYLVGILTVLGGAALFYCFEQTDILNEDGANAALHDSTFWSRMDQVKYKIIAPASGDTNNVLFYSASDDDRFEELKNALESNDTDVLWSLRGGYGSARLMDRLELLPKPKKPKLLIGYSDITVLHLWFDHWGWKSIYGAMVMELKNRNKNPNNFYMLGRILSGRIKTASYHDLRALNKEAKEAGAVTGKVIGGTLEILSDSIGTPWQIEGKDKIILIEQPTIYGYVLDRTLLHLKQAGVFKNAKAILFGTIQIGDKTVSPALMQFAGEMHIPVYKTSLFGHSSDNLPLVFGCLSTIVRASDSPDSKYTLTTDLKDLWTGIRSGQ